MREEQVREMQTIFVADKTLEELVSLFGCDISDDQDFYDVLAYNIVVADPGYFHERLGLYRGARLQGAVFGLGCSDLRDERQRDALRAFCRHEDPRVVARVIDALKDSERSDEWPGISPLASDASALVRGAVARFAAFALPPSEAFSFLTRILADPDALVRQNAVDELGELGDVQAVDFLRALLRDPDEDVRVAAATAINNLGR